MCQQKHKLWFYRADVLGHVCHGNIEVALFLDFHTSKILHVDFVAFRLKGSSCVPQFLTSVNMGLIFLSGSRIGLFSKTPSFRKTVANIVFKCRSSSATDLLWWEKEERDISTLTVAKIDPGCNMEAFALKEKKTPGMFQC